MKILFASAEVSPIAKTGGLGDVCGSLPKSLAKMGHDVVVFMPYYRQARDWFSRNGAAVEQALPTTQIVWANWSAETTYLRTTLPGTGITLILVANDYFFNRDHIYSMRFDGYDDGIERFAFFCRAVIRGCELLGFAPDIVHAHDWHAALLPIYLHSGLRGSDSFRNARSVFTIHNLNYQGIAHADRFAVLGLHSRYWAPDAVEHWGDVNLMKGAIILADQLTTVSPTYAHEIQLPANGAGLDGILRSLSFKLTGILNGIDVDEWNPATDSYLPANFERGRFDGKRLAKQALLRESRLGEKENAPLLVFVSRLVDQKGLDLLVPVLERALRAGAQAVVLGSGESRYEHALTQIGSRNRQSCSVTIGFDNALAHRMYAGGDILLMPSIYEPCGLNQMYALRYGTIPVVRMTGGLADTVIPYDGTNAGEATGFGFVAPSPSALYATTWLAMLNYKDSDAWKHLQDNGMSIDFSWEHSAQQYEVVYRRALTS